MLDTFNDERARMGYPHIEGATQDELDLVELFIENERKLIGRGPPRSSLTPPYINWVNARAALAYCKG